MKREILFKGKRIDNGEWIEGFIVKGFSDSILMCSEQLSGEHTDRGQKVGFFKSVNPETVCQFTGLLDKNGNKIFEGDKLDCCDYHADEPYQTTVRFKDGGFLVDVRGFDYDITCIGFMDDDTELEIIGNIHE